MKIPRDINWAVFGGCGGSFSPSFFRPSSSSFSSLCYFFVLRDVRRLHFLGIGLPVRSRAGFDAAGCSPGLGSVDLENRCVVGLVSGVAVDHRRGKNLPAACVSSL